MPINASSTTNIFRITDVNGYHPEGKNAIHRMFLKIKSVLNTTNRIEKKLIRQIAKDESYSEIATIAGVTTLNERLRMVGTVMAGASDAYLKAAPEDTFSQDYTLRNMVYICARNPPTDDNPMATCKKRAKEFIKKGNAGKPVDKHTYAEVIRRYYDMQFVDKFPRPQEPQALPESKASISSA